MLDFARKHSRLDSTKIMAFGRSLGGAVAFSLAHRRGSDVRLFSLFPVFLDVSVCDICTCVYEWICVKTFALIYMCAEVYKYVYIHVLILPHSRLHVNMREFIFVDKYMLTYVMHKFVVYRVFYFYFYFSLYV